MELDRIRQLTNICKLYYEENLTQKQISDKMGISRPVISKMLTEAKDYGIVKITINSPFSEEKSVRDLLIGKYGLKEAIIIDTSQDDKHTEDLQIAEKTAEYLYSTVRNGDTIVVGPGTTVRMFSRLAPKKTLPDCMVVPSTGGWGNTESEWQSNNSVIDFANKLQCHYKLLNAPSIIVNPEAYRLFVQEPTIKEVIDLAENADHIIIGIGELGKNSTLYKSGNINDKAVEDLTNKKAAASFANWYIDINGKLISSVHMGNLLGIDIEHFKKIPDSIAIAYGQQKVSAIKAVLDGSLINVLATDLTTAKSLL